MQGCLNLILRKHQKKTQEVKNLTIMTFSLLWLLFSAFHRGNQASQSCSFWPLIVPENHTHRHKNAFTGFMFLLPLSHCMNLSCLWNYAYHALKLKFFAFGSHTYFCRWQIEPVHKFQSDVFLKEFEVQVFDSRASSGKQFFSKKVLIFQLTVERNVSIERFTFLCTPSISFVVSKKRCSFSLSSQMQQYILHATNKILLTIDLGIIRKCNWI